MDLLFIDCNYSNYRPCLAGIEDRLTDGAVVVADNAGIGAYGMKDYLDHVRSKYTGKAEWFDIDLPLGQPGCDGDHDRGEEGQLMKRSAILGILLLTLAPLTAFPADDKSKSPTPPNVLFIYADDWGWGDLACHGHPHIKTPNLDGLATEGTDFQQFTVCNPVCSPSRTAIVTGHFPARHGVHEHFASHQQNVARGMPDWLDPQVTLLPRLFKQTPYV